MSNDIPKVVSSDYMSFGSSNVTRSKESRLKDVSNRWKRAALNYCWNCGKMGLCCNPCEQVKEILEKKGIKYDAC